MHGLEKSPKLETPDTTGEESDGRFENKGSGSIDIPGIRKIRSLLPPPTSFEHMISFFSDWRKTSLVFGVIEQGLTLRGGQVVKDEASYLK